MAEGWARHLHGDLVEASSAGIIAHGLNPLAVQVMEEAGVDISGQQSQRMAEFVGVPLDVVITVCGHADENCPVLPGNCRKLHVPFDDPPSLARNAASEEEALEQYRRVRDEIREFVQGLPDVLVSEG